MSNKKQRKLLFFWYLILSSFFLMFHYVEFGTAMPNDLSENNSDSSDILETNINGTMKLEWIGEGDYSESNIDGNYKSKYYINDFEYGYVQFTFDPQYYSLTDALDSDGFSISSGGTHTISSIPTSYDVDPLNSNGNEAIEWYSDIIIDVGSISGGNKGDITIRVYENSNTHDYNLQDDAEHIGDDDIVLYTFQKGYNSISQIDFICDSGVSMSVDSVHMRYHFDDGISTFKPSCYLWSDYLVSSGDGWKKDVSNLNTESNLYNVIDPHNWSYIELDFSFTYSGCNYESAIMDLGIDYDGWDGHYDDLTFNDTMIYSEYDQNDYVEYIWTSKGYKRAINIYWNVVNLYGTYITEFWLGSTKTLSSNFLYFNNTNDYPIWKNTYSSYNMIPNWDADSSVRDLFAYWHMDIDPPTITDYEIYNAINDDEMVEFNVSGTDATGSEISGLHKAYLILYDDSLSVRTALELENQDLNTFSHINYYDIPPKTYTAWYGLMDKGGNWATSENFSLVVSGAGVSITDYSLNDYQFDSSPHYVEFTLNSHYTTNAIYNFTIDDMEIQSGSYSNGQHFQIDISGYSRGSYNTKLWVNDSIGNIETINDIFYVYTTPTFTSTPLDSQNIYDWYGDLILEWNITDNGLKNYTLLKNDNPIKEDDFSELFDANVTYIIDTTLVGIGEFNYTLIVRDNESQSIEDTAILKIYEYTEPDLTLFSPDVNEDLHSTSLQMIRLNISNIILPDEYPIDSVQWDLTLSSIEWKSMSDGGIDYDYISSFDPLDYIASKDYDLWFNVSIKDHTSHIYSFPIKILPRLTYTFDEEDLNYTNNNIVISYSLDQTTEIIGEVQIDHDPIIKENNFKVIIPETYSNLASNYHIFRGFGTYYPSNPINLTEYTLWDLENVDPSYVSQDIMYFSLKKPYISQVDPPYMDQKTKNVIFIFEVNSPLSFTDITIQYKLSYFLRDTKNYRAEVYWQYQGEYVQLKNDTYKIEWAHELENKLFSQMEIYWDAISRNEIIKFKVLLIPLPQPETDLDFTMGTIIGIIILAGAGILWMLGSARSDNQLWEKWGNDTKAKLKYGGITAGILGGGFLVGFLIGMFL